MRHREATGGEAAPTVSLRGARPGVACRPTYQETVSELVSMFHFSVRLLFQVTSYFSAFLTDSSYFVGLFFKERKHLFPGFATSISPH